MMGDRKTRCRAALRPFFLAMVLVLGSALAGRAQEKTSAEMLKDALKLMEAGKYEDAASTMYMYLGEVEESKLPRVVFIAQDVRFKLATILIKSERLDEAAEILRQYVEKPYAAFPRQARKMLATCYYESSMYEECVGAVTNALYYNEHAEEIEKQARTAKDEDGEEVEDYGKIDIKPEAPYTPEDLTMLHLTLAEAYFKLGDHWRDCIEPYEYVIANTANEQRKGYAIMQIINALIEIPDFGRIMEWVPQLYRTSARYDIRVNLALLNAAAALYEAEQYDSALPLYRMILPRDVLVEYQEARIREMRVAEGLPPEMGEEMTEDEKLLFGVADDASATNGVPAVEEEKSKELRELEVLVAALKKLEPYETHVDFRMAELYKAVERFWEGLKFFERVYAVVPEQDIGERSIYEMVDILLNRLDEPAEAERRGFDYMVGHKEGITPRQLAYLLTGYYQKNDSMAAIKPLKPYLDTFVRTNDATIVQYDTELYFMQGVADLIMQNYEKSEVSFKYVLDEFPGSHQEANALYWYSMSQIFLQKWLEAYPNFEKYIRQFPDGQYIDECQFQSGICLFGQEKYEEAKERFTYVIENYPESSVFPEACSMRGDLYGAEGELDLAIADYEKAIAASKRVQQATYATFQEAAIYEAWEEDAENLDKLISIVQRYLDQWKSEADVAKGLFWIGKTMIQQKRYDEAVQTYLRAIVDFGGDLRQDGVDLMINELLKISRVYLDAEQRGNLIKSLDEALAASGSDVLSLRLRVALAKLTGSEIELGNKLIHELPDLESAPPPVLAVICDASFEMKDYSRAEEILRLFRNRFEDSDFMRAAYKLRAYGQYAEQDYEGALKTVEDAQGLYGTEYDVAWAQLMKAQILLDQGKIDESREANRFVLGIRAWRGEAVAQATYQLGQVEERAGDEAVDSKEKSRKWRQSFAFYQRTYFQYKGHANGLWAAEAYLASARVLEKLGPEFANDVRNTYRAMLYDAYVNYLPQAEVARKYLGSAETAEIAAFLEAGNTTNLTISVETDMPVGTTGSDAVKQQPQTAAPASEGEVADGGAGTDEPASADDAAMAGDEGDTAMEGAE